MEIFESVSGMKDWNEKERRTRRKTRVDMQIGASDQNDPIMDIQKVASCEKVEITRVFGLLIDPNKCQRIQLGMFLNKRNINKNLMVLYRYHIVNWNTMRKYKWFIQTNTPSSGEKINHGRKEP